MKKVGISLLQNLEFCEFTYPLKWNQASSEKKTHSPRYLHHFVQIVGTIGSNASFSLYQFQVPDRLELGMDAV
jgi:hypothetical protein